MSWDVSFPFCLSAEMIPFVCITSCWNAVYFCKDLSKQLQYDELSLKKKDRNCVYMMNKVDVIYYKLL